MYKELFLEAQAAMEKAYAPYSKFKVGAAVLTKTNKIYTGINIENSSYPVTICAERVAFSKAISEGEREFEAIAVSSSEGLGWPCGVCRQFIYEFTEDIKVIVGEDENTLIVRELRELLPEGFKL